MIAVSLLALGLPLAGVILFFVTQKPKPVPPAADPDPQLTRALEEISDKTLAPKALESGDRDAIHLRADDPAARARGVARLAASVGGSAMPSSSTEGSERLWVSLPEKRVPAFAEACRAGVQELEFPPLAENESRILIEIVVEKGTP